MLVVRLVRATVSAFFGMDDESAPSSVLCQAGRATFVLELGVCDLVYMRLSAKGRFSALPPRLDQFTDIGARHTPTRPAHRDNLATGGQNAQIASPTISRSGKPPFSPIPGQSTHRFPGKSRLRRSFNAPPSEPIPRVR